MPRQKTAQRRKRMLRIQNPLKMEGSADGAMSEDL
jgi:hypothetical protein